MICCAAHRDLAAFSYLPRLLVSIPECLFRSMQFSVLSGRMLEQETWIRLPPEDCLSHSQNLLSILKIWILKIESFDRRRCRSDQIPELYLRQHLQHINQISDASCVCSGCTSHSLFSHLDSFLGILGRLVRYRKGTLIKFLFLSRITDNCDA